MDPIPSSDAKPRGGFFLASTFPAQQLESPFHCKGLVYQGARDFYQESVPGGVEAVGSHLPRPELAMLLRDRTLAGSWYDVAPIVGISRLAARLSGVPHPRFVRENAAWMAKRDLDGVYRFLLRVTSPDIAIDRLTRLSMQYFDFGGCDGERLGQGRFISRRTGIPEPLAPWMAWAVEGFVPVVLAAAGAKEVRVRSSSPTVEGDVLGTRTVGLAFEISWK